MQRCCLETWSLAGWVCKDQNRNSPFRETTTNPHHMVFSCTLFYRLYYMRFEVLSFCWKCFPSSRLRSGDELFCFPVDKITCGRGVSWRAFSSRRPSGWRARLWLRGRRRRATMGWATILVVRSTSYWWAQVTLNSSRQPIIVLPSPSQSHFLVWLWCWTSWEDTSVITGRIRSTGSLRAYYKPSARSEARRTPCLGNYTATLSDPCKRTEIQNIHYCYVVWHVFRDGKIDESNWSFTIVTHVRIHGKSRE